MPECFADTLLIETLIPSKSGYNHQMGCFKVEGVMRFGDLKDQFAVGIIDKDKMKVKYLTEFEEIDKVSDALILWKHPKRNHFIIQICPALEKWIIKICETEQINMEELGLSSNLKTFQEYTKTRASVEDAKLRSLFKIINRKNNVEEVRKLKEWVKLLKEKNYNVDINDLKNG